MSTNLIVIKSSYHEAKKNIIRNRDATKEELQQTIIDLAEELAKKIQEKFYINEQDIITPMSCNITGPYLYHPRTVIITTKDDRDTLAFGFEKKFKNTILGFMDFEGRRGLQALKSPVRSIELPDSKEPVVNLIVGKTVLATGCTAISLTKEAMQKYMPRQIIVASIFYSEQGIREIFDELPNVNLIVIGEPDSLNKEGMLVPGIGNLDERIHA